MLEAEHRVPTAPNWLKRAEANARLDSVRKLGTPFCRPCAMVMNDQGEYFAADGYGNDAVHKFDANGSYAFSWGGPGGELGRFPLVHGICIDCRGRVWVSDRENCRVQVFDQGGRLLAVIAGNLMRIGAVWTDFQHAYIGELDGGVTIYGAMCVLVERSDGKKILFDPYITKNLQNHTALESFYDIDYLLVTHNAGDHFGDADVMMQNSNAVLLSGKDVNCRVQKLIKLPRERWHGTIYGDCRKLDDVTTVHVVNAIHHSKEALDDLGEASHPAFGFIVGIEPGVTYYHVGDTCLFGDIRTDQSRPFRCIAFPLFLSSVTYLSAQSFKFLPLFTHDEFRQLFIFLYRFFKSRMYFSCNRAISNTDSFAH